MGLRVSLRVQGMGLVVGLNVWELKVRASGEKIAEMLEAQRGKAINKAGQVGTTLNPEP